MRACHTMHRRAQDGPRDQPAFAEGSKPEAAGRDMARTTQPPAPVAGGRGGAVAGGPRGERGRVARPGRVPITLKVIITGKGLRFI